MTPLPSDPLNKNAVTGQRHPDHEFLYQVGTSPDGRPIWASILQSKIPTESRDRESGSGHSVGFRIPSRMQSNESGSDPIDKK
jgi:hypothetical protein